MGQKKVDERGGEGSEQGDCGKDAWGRDVVYG